MISLPLDDEAACAGVLMGMVGRGAPTGRAAGVGVVVVVGTMVGKGWRGYREDEDGRRGSRGLSWAMGMGGEGRDPRSPPRSVGVHRMTKAKAISFFKL